MKQNFAKIAFTFVCLIFSLMAKAQITVKYNDFAVNNQDVGLHSPLSFGTNQSVSIRLGVEVYSQNGENPNYSGTYTLFRSNTGLEQDAVSVTSMQIPINGNYGYHTFYETLSASSFPTSGGVIYVEYKTYGGIKYKSAFKAVTKTVTPAITNNTITGNQTIYYGQSATLSGNIPSGGNGTFSYVWNKKVGNDNWEPISGATQQNFYIGNLTTNTQFRRVANSGSASSSFSNVVTVTVNSSLPITNNIISINQTINEGNTANALTGNVPSGGSGPSTFSYLWQKKIASTAWTTISGATGQGYAPGTPFVTTTYRRIARSGNAVDNTSNEIIVTVIPAPPIQNNMIGMVGGTIEGTLPTGGIGTYTYTWMLWGGEEPYTFQETGQNLIIPEFIYEYLNNYPNLSIVRIVSSGSQSSNSNYITVLPLSQIQNNNLVLNGSQINGSIPTGGNGTYQYSWVMLGGEEPYTFPNATQDLMITSDIYNYLQNYPQLIIYRIVKSGNRISYSNNIEVVPLPEIQNNSISANGFQINGSLPTGGDGSYTYSWFLSSPEDPIIFSETTKDLNITQYNYAIWILQNYPSSFLVRTVKSGNKTSNSNFFNIYSGRSVKESSKATNDTVNYYVKAYPNPTTRVVNFQTNLTATDAEVAIYNESGKNVVIFKGNLNEGQIIQWNIPSDYPKGLYFYKISSGNHELKVGKIIYQ